MKKSICLYFQVHQPSRLRLYRFFDIGKDSHYYDDFANRTILRRVAQRCYLPMNALLLEMIGRYKGQFKVAFSVSGTVIEQFDRYAPEVIESFRKLADTGCVEFLSETYYHSLASLAFALLGVPSLCSFQQKKTSGQRNTRFSKKLFRAKKSAFHFLWTRIIQTVNIQNSDKIYSASTSGSMCMEIWVDAPNLLLSALSTEVEI